MPVSDTARQQNEYTIIMLKPHKIRNRITTPFSTISWGLRSSVMCSIKAAIKTLINRKSIPPAQFDPYKVLRGTGEENTRSLFFLLKRKSNSVAQVAMGSRKQARKLTIPEISENAATCVTSGVRLSEKQLIRIPA